MRKYEVVFISAPNTAEGDLNKITSQLENVVSERGGKLTKVDNWGRRKLAYRIKKFDEGIYTLLHIEGSGQEISEVERRLRVTDFVIRHLTVRTDEDLKRAEKMKAKRKSLLVPREKDEDFDIEEVMEEEEDLLH
ncbi:MAG: 30S ribosomal protein S6 [Blastocatellia bacterium]|nr:30S ribosomal protein S6 [Blastocatellia bacterium]